MLRGETSLYIPKDTFANVAPKAPYGPNNNPKINNTPICELYIPYSKSFSGENMELIAIISINDIAVFISLDFIISLF